MKLAALPGIEIQVRLAPYTTLRIGGPAEYFYIARHTADLLQAIELARNENIPIIILGGGSNVLISDQGLAGLVIRNLTDEINFLEDNTIEVSSGYSLPIFTQQLAQKGYDTSFLAGIPGTLGGAIRGNAGAWGGSIGPAIQRAELFNTQTGETIKVDHDWFQFSYRHSELKNHPELVLISAKLRFEQKNSSEVLEQIKTYLSSRQDKQPRGHTCGSVFQNPEDDSAGRLIDACGLKGKQVGGMIITEKHANFFANTRSASAQDFLTLVKLAQDKVQKKFHVKLQPEFQLLGFSTSEIDFLQS